VRAAGWQRERPPRSNGKEPPSRVKKLGEREQVMLVGPAAVEEDERARWVARGRPRHVDQCPEATHACSLSIAGIR